MFVKCQNSPVSFGLGSNLTKHGFLFVKLTKGANYLGQIIIKGGFRLKLGKCDCCGMRKVHTPKWRKHLNYISPDWTNIRQWRIGERLSWATPSHSSARWYQLLQRCIWYRLFSLNCQIFPRNLSYFQWGKDDGQHWSLAIKLPDIFMLGNIRLIPVYLPIMEVF